MATISSCRLGLARYLRYQQREEICTELLRENGIVISAGTVTNLCDRFLMLLERLHHYRIPALRAAMGGDYPLHIDATSEHGKGGLFLCIDGWRGWVLHSVKIASENEDELRPAVEKTVSLFGDPIAVVRDLSKAEAGAVDKLRDRGIPDLVCHYHYANFQIMPTFRLCQLSVSRPFIRRCSLRWSRHNHSPSRKAMSVSGGR